MHNTYDNHDPIPGLDALEFADNPDQRTPCVLLLDTSSSMHGRPITQLNAGLQTFKHSLMEDILAQRRVEVAIVTFGGAVTTVQDFITASDFTPPNLEAGGGTPLGAGLNQAISLLNQRLMVYQQNGIPQTLPWIFLITDGAPTDQWQAAATLARQLDARRDLALFAVGVEGADMGTLEQIAPPNRPPLKLAGLEFHKLFEWLSQSLRTTSQNAPNAQVALPPPTGWAQL